MKKKNELLILAITMIFGFQINTFGQTNVSNWSYIQVDDTKSKWGDYDAPDWLRYFGLDAGDLNNDGLDDILSGRWVYLNPGGQMDSEWSRKDLGLNVDGILVMDVDGDEYGDIIAQGLPSVYWIEATDTNGDNWKAIKIGAVPATSHTNSQGFTKAQIIAGGKEEFVIAGNGNIYSFEIPANPSKDQWKITLVAENTSDEGIGTGDIDGDGDIDIAAGRRPEGEDEPKIVVWYENPGDGSGNWNNYEIGTTNHPADRFGVADLNGDSKADIVVCEERWPGEEPDGNIFWYEQGENNTEKWNRHRIATQYSTNNLFVIDMDKDGDTDLITSEHKGSILELQLWENNGTGEFTKEILDTGKESHLGTQLADLDHDGDMDIVSAGWDQHQFVHLWRNDTKDKDSRNWRLVSSSNGEIETPNNGNQQTAALISDVDMDGDMDFFISERTQAPSLTMFRYDKGKWERHIIDDQPLRIEAGSAAYDIDGDGDEDVVFAGESQSNEVWWWENPFPKFNPEKPWTRRTIKKSGANKHHDQIFGDVDGDGKAELVFWNQGGHKLIVAEIPKNPKKSEEWPMTAIYTYSIDSEMEPLVGLNGYPGWQSVNEHEGLDLEDIDGDGLVDIVGGGRWFKFTNGSYTENLIDASYTFSRSASAQLIEGGRPEVLLVVGDGKGPLYMYEWHEWTDNKKGTGSWKKTLLLKELDNGHSIDILDFNGDGHMDIFSGEMRFGEENPDAKTRVLLGDGKGNFREMLIAKGYGIHEGKMADLDGDGDMDVLGKPYTWKAPLLNIWINEGPLR